MDIWTTHLQNQVCVSLVFPWENHRGMIYGMIFALETNNPYLGLTNVLHRVDVTPFFYKLWKQHFVWLMTLISSYASCYSEKWRVSTEVSFLCIQWAQGLDKRQKKNICFFTLVKSIRKKYKRSMTEMVEGHRNPHEDSREHGGHTNTWQKEDLFHIRK